jgi:uncharacterized protein (DUF1015 family)
MSCTSHFEITAKGIWATACFYETIRKGTQTMASVIPFRGLLYNLAEIKNLQDVVTPPYDVISPEEQDAFYKSHPHNVIRLILGKAYPTDTETDNWYTRAAADFEKWQAENMLVQDMDPAFYFTEVDYSTHGTNTTRCGLIALVALEGFDRGIILPHERTFSATKSERLRLMETCHANFSPIFSLYPDPQNRVIDHLKQAVADNPPDIDFEDRYGFHHRLWRITDRETIDAVGTDISHKPLYIADGHHRYETGLNYRNKRLAGDPDLAEDASCRYVMMCLSSMHDPGLTVLPAHRLIHDVTKEKTDIFLDRAMPFFEMQTFHGTDQREIETAFLNQLESNSRNGNAIGVFMKGNDAFYILQLREGVMEHLFGDRLPDILKKLDVTVLTQVILKKMLELDEKDLDNESKISYTSKVSEVIDAVRKCGCALAFIMNPTKIEQVQKVADARLIMPRKSTYFYPKVITGLVLNKID